MSSLSSDTLFHFTDRMEHLLNILTNEFRPHFSLQDLSLASNQVLTNEERDQAFPMVSFCDIPLSQTTAHTNTYGNYAIGLTKKWGMRHGISPVLYCYQNCPANVAIGSLLHMPVGKGIGSGPGDDIEKHLIDNIAYLSCFLKPYEGPFYHRGRSIPNVRFYDEREWRYVPDIRKRDVEALSRAEYLNPQRLRVANEKAFDMARVKFEPSDIRYIIVATEREILPMIESIDRIKGRYSTDERRVLTTRIISAEHVRSDF